jgi:hypothetical protein
MLSDTVFTGKPKQQGDNRKCRKYMNEWPCMPDKETERPAYEQHNSNNIKQTTEDHVDDCKNTPSVINYNYFFDILLVL